MKRLLFVFCVLAGSALCNLIVLFDDNKCVDLLSDLEEFVLDKGDLQVMHPQSFDDLRRLCGNPNNTIYALIVRGFSNFRNLKSVNMARVKYCLTYSLTPMTPWDGLDVIDRSLHGLVTFRGFCREGDITKYLWERYHGLPDPTVAEMQDVLNESPRSMNECIIC